MLLAMQAAAWGQNEQCQGTPVPYVARTHAHAHTHTQHATHPKCCTPISGATAASRSSAAAANQAIMPPMLTPEAPMRVASTSGRDAR